MPKDSKPVAYMLTKQQAEQLKKLGLYREPNLPPDNWPESFIKQSFENAINKLINQGETK